MVLPAECLSVKICGCISPSDSETNRDGPDAESPLRCFFSASFKDFSPREKVGKLSSFWDWWAECLFVSIIAANIIFFPALTMAARAKNEILTERFAHAISVHYRDFEHAYVY